MLIVLMTVCRIVQEHGAVTSQMMSAEFVVVIIVAVLMNVAYPMVTIAVVPMHAEYLMVTTPVVLIVPASQMVII
jgi:hypothetical protein